MIKDSLGNVSNGGSLQDHIKLRPQIVQPIIDAKLTAKVESDPLGARAWVDIVKAAGATVAAATEDKVVAAETAKVAKETLDLSEKIWAMIDKEPASAVKLYDESKAKYVFSSELDKAIDEIRK